VLTTVHDCLDPDVLVAEYTSEGEVTTTGKPYANTYIGIWRFRDGRVCGLKEFYNPLISQRALAAD
jgi:ketosteroid isomerase-like protein